MMPERRSHPRLPATLRASVAAGALRFDATCTNIGMGGAFLACGVDLRPGMRIDVAVRPARCDGAVVLLTGTVVYVVKKGGRRAPGLGVRWEGLEGERASRPLRYLLHDLTHPDGDRRHAVECATIEHPAVEGQPQQVAAAPWEGVALASLEPHPLAPTEKYAIVKKKRLAKPAEPQAPSATDKP